MDAGETSEDTSKLRDEVGALREQLVQARQGTHEFLAMLAHELRTPLGAILMWAHVLRMGHDNDREAALDAIEVSARAQSKLIGTVLDLTRALAGRLRIEKLPVDLGAIAQAAVEEVQTAAPPPAVKVNLSIASAVSPVLGDPLRLQQMVAALVRNALRASPYDGEVQVEVAAAAGVVRLAVRDQGSGLSAADRAGMFTAFRLTGEPDRRAPGSLGLELPLVRLLAELHGAQVTAHSEEGGRGSILVLEVPAAR